MKAEFAKLGLTEMETKTMQALIDGLYAEPGFSDISPKDLSQTTGIGIKSMRGVLGSLTKKGLIFIDEYAFEECKGIDRHGVYLDEDHYYLHPTWNQ